MSSADASLRILLVEDCPEDREHFRWLMEKDSSIQYVFSETESGEEALEICKSDPPDCVLLDYQLPDLDGIEFLNELDDETGNVIVPVVMLTGVGNEAVAVNAIKQGAQDYLVKGEITAESLHRAVLNAIDKTELHRKLAEQNKELEQFVYVASHDLKAPLRTISSFCGLLGQKYHGKLDEKADKFITMIQNATRQMGMLIDSLLEYSRIGRSDRQKPPETVDLDHVLKTVLANLDALVQQSESRIEVGPMPTIQGHKTALVQIFQNLISNAIKFRGDRSPVITVTATQSNTGWQFSVADNGIGIDPKYHRDVMTPFRRLHSVSEYEGTGLGLAICEKIAKRHGGGIWVDSTYGEGSTFHFSVAMPAVGEISSSPTPAVAPVMEA